MHRYSQADLDLYMHTDDVQRELDKFPADAHFASHEWLLKMPAKRMIYADVYGNLLKEKGKRILDIGGGFCGLSRTLIENHDYTLVDNMYHDPHEHMNGVIAECGDFWSAKDWLDFVPNGEYDYVIANDLFPNVDQRLEMFLNKFKPYAKKIVVTLTAYDNDRFYKVKRLDAEEVLTVVPWSTTMIEFVVEKKADSEGASLFPNGRQVYKLVL